MKKLLTLLLLVISIVSSGQEKPLDLQRVFRINAITPGIEYEHPLSSNSTIAINPGLGGSIGYSSNLNNAGSGFFYYIVPFLDLSYKKFYNREKRLDKGKTLAYNSGNFWSIRLMTNFKEIYSYNINRTHDNIGWAFGPTWGLQRTYGRLHLLFDIGVGYYIDVKGNNGFIPIMLQLNLGFNAKKW